MSEEMKNNELTVLVSSLHSMEDAYALAQKDGYQGSMDDFKALCEKAAREQADEAMDLESMDAVAGGSWDSFCDWVSDHKTEIIGVTAGAATLAAVIYGVRSNIQAHNNWIEAEMRAHGQLPPI